MKKYRVALPAEERQTLGQLTRSGNTAARKLTRARSVLKADAGLSDEELAEEGGTSVPTVERTRRRFVEESLGALTERPRPGQRPKLAAKGEAPLIAVACSKAPGERKRWTLGLLADKAVELGLCEQLSDETVRGLRKKPPSSLGNTSSGAFPR
jgi:transposase